MARRRTKNFVVSGGILTTDFLLNLQEEEPKQPLIKPNTFNIPPNLIIKNQNQLDNMIKESWERLLEKWDEISVKLKSMNESDSKQKWTIPLLKALDFIDIQYSSKDIAFEDGKIQVFISHRGWARADAPKIHIVGPNQELDSRLDTDRNNKSPHDSLQLYLKLDKSLTKWGIVTNGLQIRLLRDFFHTHTRGYVEFDMESIFYERNFTDFRALYRLIHASRFLKEENNHTILDKFYEESVAAGTKIGEGLRENVKKAIELIGNGLLTHEMRELMILNKDITKEFYQEVLSIIYRILFLMFAEQRGMLPMHNSLYIEEYSITKLRERSERRTVSDNHYDLWYGLIATFSLIREGSKELEVFGYNGDLFDDSTLNHICELRCRNDFLLRAIKYLTLYEKGKILQRINFLDLGVEEIGSIYESLLDFTPRVLESSEEINGIEYKKGEFFLDPRGIGRKTTGSYYTNIHLIEELIKNSLKPVIDNILSKVDESKEEKEKAVLQIKICDPACGSGAFLIAANNYLGEILANIRCETEYPPVSAVKIAKRDILSKCIYGVDLNPMAIELARVSLWINAAVENFPLNFLNHHLKCGNSLIGTTFNKVKKGIPNKAFQAIEFESREVANELRKMNSVQKKHKYTLEGIPKKVDKLRFKEFERISNLVEDSKEDVIRKKTEYQKLLDKDEFRNRKLLYDFWTISFFWPFINEFKHGPTQGLFKLIQEKYFDKVNKKIIDKLNEIVVKYNIFHWELEFPEIFNTNNPGFDCILGNPPWEKLNFEEKQFFSVLKPDISKAQSATKRKKMIRELKKSNPLLWSNYIEEKTKMLKYNKFLRNSEIYNNTAKGQINLFAVFSELSMSLINNEGYIGIIVPSNLITDFTYQDFFKGLMERNQLVRLADFINNKGIFTDLHRMYKFCLLSATKMKREDDEKSIFSFFNEKIEDLIDEKEIELSKSDIELINPNTLTCPIFPTKKDYSLSMKIYKSNPILHNKEKPVFPNLTTHRMFNISDDSHLLKTYEDIEKHHKEHFTEIYLSGDDVLLPIYESKMIWIYDHRFASFESCTKQEIAKGRTCQHPEKKANIKYSIKPRYWIAKDFFDEKKERWNWEERWFLSFRNITNARNWRTAVASITPNYPTVYTIRHIVGINPEEALFLISIINSFVFDYCARLKVGGTHLDHFIIEQLPIIDYEKWKVNKELIIQKSLELIYTSDELFDFAKQLGHTGEPYVWDEYKRKEIQSELDAVYAILYGLSKDDLEYILDTFPIQKTKDINEFGDYRTKLLIIKFYKKYKSIIKEDI